MIRRRQLLLTVTFVLCGCASDPPAADPGLTFLHLNDTYRIDAVEDGASGGFGRVTTLIRELAADGRDVRLLHGGDFLYPSLESQLWDGRQMVEAFNYMDALAPMYVVPGNHEFDPREPDALIDAVRLSEFTWIADNQRFETGQPDVDRALRSGFVAETGDYRIGLFGLNLHADDGGNRRDYAPIDPDYLASAERAIMELETRDADLIIGLTHLHLDDDRKVAELKARHPRFVLIAGGHEHEPEFEPGSGSRAAIVKGASNARVIWRIDVSGDPAAGVPRVETTRIAIDRRIDEDPDYNRFSGEWRERLLERMPFLPSRLGEAAVPLDGRETTVRNEESNLGNFIVDQMPGAFGEPADLAFINSGTLRIDDYIAGDITWEDIARVFGFSSYLRRMTIDGAAFRALLEAGYRGSGPSKGYFPQVSGFRVCVDRSRPEGGRIVALEVARDDGTFDDIDPEADYSLVAPDYLYGGGDGYDFSAARDATPPGSELKYLVIDAIVEAQANGEAVGAPVDPAAPRIDVLRGAGEGCFEDREST